MGRVRKFSREQGDRTVRREFSGFLQGMNTDSDPSALQQGEVAYLKNLLGFRSELRVRKGTAQVALSGGTHTGLTMRSAIRHPNLNLEFVHVNSFLYSKSGTVLTVLSSTMPNSASRMRVFNNEVLVATTSGLYTTELGGTAVRQANLPGPTFKPTIAWNSQDPEGNYSYRYLCTYARILTVGGVVTILSESETYHVGTVLNDFVQIDSSVPISESGAPKLTGIVDPLNAYTHVGIYRTLNIGVGATGTSLPENSSEAYYLCGYVAFADVGLLNPSGIGSMVIQGVAPNTFRVGRLFDALQLSDNDLLVNQTKLLQTRLLRPLPSNLAIDVAPGFIATASANQVQYSETGKSAAYAFLFDPATQFYNCPSPVTSIETQPGRFAVFCANTSTVGTYSSYQSITTDSLGIATATITSWQELDSILGVPDAQSTTKLPSGEVAAFCTDRAIRIWDGTAWGVDFSAKSVHSLLGAASTALLAYDGQYGLIVWLSSGLTYRYGFREDTGKGWSELSGLGFSGLYGNYALSRTATGAITAIAYTLDTQLQLSLFSSADDNGTAIACSVRLPNCVGEEQTYYCRANETSAILKADSALARESGISDPSFSSIPVTCKTFANGVQSDESLVTGIPISTGAYFARFFPNGSGNTLQTQLDFSTSVGGRILSIICHYQVQDQQIDMTALPEAVLEKALADYTLVLHATRPHYTMNRVDRSFPDLVPVLTDGATQGIRLLQFSFPDPEPTWSLPLVPCVATVVMVAKGLNSSLVSLNLGGITLEGFGGVEDSLLIFTYADRPGTNSYYYVNGVLAQGAHKASASLPSFRLGESHPPVGAIRIYSRVLSQDEISFLATQFKLGKYSEIEPQ